MMRANLKAGKLVPPRSMDHAARRREQLLHELRGISNARQPGSKPSPTELALRDELEQLTRWCNAQKGFRS